MTGYTVSTLVDDTTVIVVISNPDSTTTTVQFPTDVAYTWADRLTAAIEDWWAHPDEPRRPIRPQIVDRAASDVNALVERGIILPSEVQYLNDGRSRWPIPTMTTGADR